MNRQGYRIKLGNPFGKNIIYDILINEKYKGTCVFNKRSSKDSLGRRNNRRFKDNENVIRIPNGMPAIIDEQTFDKVQEEIQTRKRGPRMSEKRFYLLTGKIFCGECGSVTMLETATEEGVTAKNTLFTPVPHVYGQKPAKINPSSRML